ncbi:MAG: HD domain-containing protein, partial [Deltaproteobacteria bacterium]|nr:HD domain-containing protein [Deltaproteobacteria bacterium]
MESLEAIGGSQLEDALKKIRILEKEIAGTIALTQSKVYQLECLANFSAILNSTLDTSTVREKAMEATCKLLTCETGSLLLADAAKRELYWETALGPSGAELKTFRLPIDETSIAGHVALTGRPMLINDVSKNPFHFKKADEKTSFTTKNMVCVPVIAKGNVIGVLQAINKVSGDFESEDVGLLETLSYQVAIAIENAMLYTKLKDTFLQTASAMAGAIEAKDRYTGGHTKRVLHYSMAIADYVNLSVTERENLRLAAILHDIGKIGIDDKVLKKQYALNDDEYEIMKKHPAIGHEILSQVDGLKDIVDAMRYHHERPDGKGYPYGLSGDQIPKIASIISVADTYDAMVSTRPYRKGLDPQIAFGEIVKYRGSQFDAEIVDAFVKAF